MAHCRCTHGQTLLLLKCSTGPSTAVPEYPAEEKAPPGLKSPQWLTNVPVKPNKISAPQTDTAEQWQSVPFSAL